MQCAQCRAELKPGSRFCGKCGSAVGMPVVPPNTPNVAPAPAPPMPQSEKDASLPSNSVPLGMTEEQIRSIIGRNLKTLQETGYQKVQGKSCPSCNAEAVYFKTLTQTSVQQAKTVNPPMMKNLGDLLIMVPLYLLYTAIVNLVFRPKEATLETDTFKCAYCAHEWTDKQRVQK